MIVDDRHDRELSDVDRHRIQSEVDYFVAQFVKGHGLTDEDIREAVQSLRWLKEHRDFMRRVEQGTMMSLIALIVTAVATAVWAGVKAMIAGVR